MAMGRPRQGTIDKLADGRFRLRVGVAGSRGQVGTYATRVEAEAMRLAVLDELERRGEPTETMLVGTWVASWLDQREIERAVADVASERGRFRTSIENDPIAKLPLRKLTRADVLAWVARVRARGLAHQSVRNTIGVLRGALERAVDAEKIKANPARRIVTPRDTRTTDAWTWLRPEEVARLLEAFEAPERHVVAFAIFTGLRAGELCALREVDVHEDHVIVRYGGPPDMPTKTRRSRRVPLFAPARAALASWRDERTAWASRGDGKKNPLGLAFQGRRGAFRDPNHVVRWDTWKGALERAGITRPLRWHDLRHTCASSLVSGVWGRAWSLLEVRDVLGHTSVSVTERYAHLATDAVDAAARSTPGPTCGPLVVQADFGDSAKSSELLGAPDKDRTCDLRFRKPEGSATKSRTYELPDQIVATSRAFLLAVEGGGDASGPLSEMRSALVTVLGDAIAGLSGPHAIATATRIARDVLELAGERAEASAKRRKGRS